MPYRIYRREVALMGHAIKDFAKGRLSWRRAFHIAHFNRRCASCDRFAMSTSLYCGPCWQRDKIFHWTYRVSPFAPGTGRLAVVEPAEHTPVKMWKSADGEHWTPAGIEVGEGFTVPAGFAALGD